MNAYRTLAFLCIVSLLINSCLPPSVLSNKEIMLGDASANNYEYAGAISHYQNFCKINEQLGLYRNFAREGEVLRKMAYVYSLQGNFKNALKSFLGAAQIDSSQNDALSLLDDFRGIGNCYLYMGDYKKGLHELKKCIALSQKYESGLKQTHRLVAANVNLSLGNCYALLSNYDSSNYYLNKAIRIFKLENETYGLMVSLLKTGLNKTDLSDYSAGINLITQSMDLALGLKLSTSEHLMALGNIYSAMGDYEKALINKRQAITQADSSGNISQQIVSNISLGDLYTEVGDLQTALIYYNKASNLILKHDVEKKDAQAIVATRKGQFRKSLDFYDGSGASFSSALTYLKIGISYFEKKDYDSCLLFLNKSDKQFSGEKKNDTKALLHIYRAASLIESGKFKHVQAILDSAIASNQNPENEWKILYYSGRISEQNNDLISAENKYSKAVGIIENIWSRIQSDELKSSFMDIRIQVYDRLIKILNQQNKAAESFSIAEKARNRAFLDMLAKQKKGISYNGEDTILASENRNLKTKILKLKEKLYDQSHSIVNAKDSGEIARSMLENELLKTNNDYDKFLSKLKAQNSKLVQLIKPEVADANSVISQLDSNTVLLEYWLSSEKLYVWTISKSGIHLSTVPFGAKETNILYESLVYFSQKSKKTAYYLSELYKLLIAPIRSKLNDNCNLIIVPHGFLHFVPFQALTDEKNCSMVEYFQISYVPSASILNEAKKKDKIKGNSLLAMALGNLSIDNMAPLASTISEVENIARLYKNSVSRIEKECTVDYFNAKASDFDYIHLATHGVYNSKSPFSSYILFNKTESNDGKLKVSDIFGLKLKANLVTLSACQTGLGNISNSDELVGLSRAFIFAGAPAIIVSLWNVADAPTAKLMTYFYEFLKTKPTNIALSLAQRKLMLEYKEPYFWAPFVLIGSNE
jgi:CHAT domain-containing protein